MSVNQTQLLHPELVAAGSCDSRRSRTTWMMPLAGGILLGALAFDLFPAAFAALGWHAAVWAAAGLATMALAGGRLQLPEGRRLAWVGTIGIWMHSLLEGLVAGASYEVGATVGVLLTVALLMHLIPEASALSAFASQAKDTGRLTAVRVAIALALVAGGFLTARLALPGLEMTRLGPPMGFAAGMFGYLSAITLRRSQTTVAAGAGWALLGLVWMAALHV